MIIILYGHLLLSPPIQDQYRLCFELLQAYLTPLILTPTLKLCDIDVCASSNITAI